MKSKVNDQGGPKQKRRSFQSKSTSSFVVQEVCGMKEVANICVRTWAEPHGIMSACQVLRILFTLLLPELNFACHASKTMSKNTKVGIQSSVVRIEQFGKFGIF